MHTWLKTLSRYMSPQNLIGLGIAVYLGVTAASLLQTDHFLQNLEPYPDGLLYALSARNAVMGEGMYLSYLDSSMDYWVPPLYSVVLAPAYLFWSQPQAFVIMNIVLGIATLVLLGKLVWNTTGSALALITAVMLYLAHGHVLWLPSLPMAENLSLFLIVAGLYTLFSVKQGWKQLLMLISIAVGLVLTKFAAVVLAGALVSIAIWHMRHSISRKHWVLLSGALVGVGIIYGLLIANPLVMLQGVVASLLSPDSLYYGTRFLLPNAQSYVAGHLGQSAPFLWQSVPLTSVAVIVISLVYFWRGWRHVSDKMLAKARALSILFLAQFPLLLVFYIADLRYSIYSIPLATLAVTWCIHEFPYSKKWVPTSILRSIKPVLLGLILLPLLFSQRSLFRELVASNILGRSVGWQAESSVQLHTAVQKQLLESDKPTYLITALPPFLYDSYVSPTAYQLLPLSIDQEFISKQRWVWGSEAVAILNNAAGTNFVNSSHIKSDEDLDIRAFSQSDLHALIISLLEGGQEVYISNAYVTHQASVVRHYEEIGELFTLTEVASGCEGVCNVYKVQSTSIIQE